MNIWGWGFARGAAVYPCDGTVRISVQLGHLAPHVWSTSDRYRYPDHSGGFHHPLFAGAIWSHEPTSLETPFAGRELRSGGLVLGIAEVLIVVVTAILTLAFYLFFSRTRMGLAMQAASQNQLAAIYMGIPVKRIHSLCLGTCWRSCRGRRRALCIERRHRPLHWAARD